MIGAMDNKGRTVFIAESRSQLKPYAAEIKRGGETYRIVKRGLSAQGGTTVVFVLTVTGRRAGR